MTPHASNIKQIACPRCGEGFTCNSQNIAECLCSGIKLGDDAMKFIKSKYKDCLCIPCLHQLNVTYQFFKRSYETN